MNLFLYVKNDINLLLDLAQMSVILDFTHTGEHQNRGPDSMQSKIYINLLVYLG